MSDLIGYTWGIDNITYFYRDGGNWTVYRSLPKVSGCVDSSLWLCCLVVVVVVAAVVACVCLFKRRYRYNKK